MRSRALWNFFFSLFPLTDQRSKSVRRNLYAAPGRPFGPNSAKLGNGNIEKEDKHRGSGGWRGSWRNRH